MTDQPRAGSAVRYAEITGWGKALPPTVLANSDLEKIVDTSDEWITSRTGIKERRISHVEATDLAVVASRHALAAAGLEAAKLDLIINATCTPESLIPASASYVQAKLEAVNAGAMDLNANCSGFVYAFVTASAMIQAGVASRILIIGVEKLSFVTDFTDRNTCILFGDGAGAVVLEASDQEVGMLASELGVDGTTTDLLHIPVHGTKGVPGPRDPATSGIQMEGTEVFRRAVTMMGESSAGVIERAGWTLADVDLLVPHQANQRIIDATARRLKLDSAKVFVNIHAYGNTSAATVPIALTEALEQGRIAPGSNIVFAAFGGGLTWAAAAVKWGSRVEPIEVSDAVVPATDLTLMELLAPNFDYFGGGSAS
jgi:3-oxoacyl-[acyl-carrier-protein] synthase-3